MKLKSKDAVFIINKRINNIQTTNGVTFFRCVLFTFYCTITKNLSCRKSTQYQFLWKMATRIRQNLTNIHAFEKMVWFVLFWNIRLFVSRKQKNTRFFISNTRLRFWLHTPTALILIVSFMICFKELVPKFSGNFISKLSNTKGWAEKSVAFKKKRLKWWLHWWSKPLWLIFIFVKSKAKVCL